MVTAILNSVGATKRAESSAAVLTAREVELCLLLADGKCAKEAAGEMGISYKTADTHRSNAMRKLGIHSGPQLGVYVERNLRSAGTPLQRFNLVQVSDGWCVELDKAGKPIRRMQIGLPKRSDIGTKNQ